MTIKDKMLQAVQELPDDASIEEVMELIRRSSPRSSAGLHKRIGAKPFRTRLSKTGWRNR